LEEFLTAISQVDFEHTNKMGFADPEVTVHPTMQYAFQYTTVELAPCKPSDLTISEATNIMNDKAFQDMKINGQERNGEGGGHTSVEINSKMSQLGKDYTVMKCQSFAVAPSQQQQWVLQRRLRVVTLRVRIQGTPSYHIITLGNN
jgi:hypothetical protein